jgi:putative sugar O-methyltransferase
MKNKNELSFCFEEMSKQSELYKPTSFWSDASKLIVSEIEEFGIENFRSLPSTLSYFVPTFGNPGNGISEKAVEDVTALLKGKYNDQLKLNLSLSNFFSGEFSALSDYRVFLGSDIPEKKPFLSTFSESTFGNPKEQFCFDGKMYSRSSLNYILGLVFLKKHLQHDLPSTVLEIGGGFGSLGEILMSSGIENIKYIDIDIPPTSYVAHKYLSHKFGKENVSSFEDTKDFEKIEIENLPKLSVLCSWQIEKIIGKIDLFVNFISFQEMEPDVVENYFSHIERLGPKWILLRNMKEGKNVKNHTSNVPGVEKPIKSEDYISMIPNYELVDRNVIPFGFRTVDGFNSELLLLKRK